MSKKRQHKPRVTIDTEVVNEIDKQHNRREEIENRRRKQVWIFWSFAVFGAVVISAGVLAFLFLILEWQNMPSRYRSKERENYSWEVIQDIIDKEVSSAFRLREPSPIQENDNRGNK